MCYRKFSNSNNSKHFSHIRDFGIRRVDRNLPDLSFDSNSLEFSEKISMLGATLGSDLSWNDHISTTAKAVACKLGLLFRSRSYFTSSPLLTLYKAQIRPVSNMALICGEGPPSILLPHWMQFRSEQLN